MSTTSLEQAFNTTELLELILLALPLSDLVKVRSVSCRFKEVIERSRYWQQLCKYPYVGVRIQLPEVCSQTEGEPPILQAALILYYAKPITVCTNRPVVKYPSKVFCKFEKGQPEPADWPYVCHTTWGGRYNIRPHRFTPINIKMRWTTLYPGVPYLISWAFRRQENAYPKAAHGNLSMTEVGKTYVLKLRPNMDIGHLIGTKSSLLAQRQRGADLGENILDAPLMLVAENKVQFRVVA